MVRKSDSATSPPNLGANRIVALTALREGTRKQHSQLESVINVSRLTESRESYELYLAKFLGIWRPLESALRGVPIEGLPLESRTRSDLIAEDLRKLGRSKAEIDATPDCCELPSAGSVADAAGILYVLEGSRLGGQVICKQLAKHGIVREQGTSFFFGHGDETVPRWREFCQWLNETLEDHPDISTAVAAARDTFQCFVDWFSIMKPPQSSVA